MQQMLPAAAQGVIGIECLEDRTDLLDLIGTLAHAPTGQTTIAERAVARELQADCQSPVASFATIAGKRLTIEAMAAAPDGSILIRDAVSGDVHEAELLGIEVARKLLQRGADKLLQEL